MKTILLPLFFSCLFASGDSALDPVDNPNVAITHRLDDASLTFPAYWAQREEWRILETGLKGPQGQPAVRREKVKREVLAMEAAAWAKVISEKQPLAENEAGVLPADGRLLLHWSPSQMEIEVTPAFYRNPSKDAEVIAAFFKTHALTKTVSQENSPTMDQLRGLKPLDPNWSPKTPKTPNETSWSVGKHAENASLFDSFWGMPLPGVLKFTVSGNEAQFTGGKTDCAYQIIIAHSLESDDLWIWAEEKK